MTGWGWGRGVCVWLASAGRGVCVCVCGAGCWHLLGRLVVLLNVLQGTGHPQGSHTTAPGAVGEDLLVGGFWRSAWASVARAALKPKATRGMGGRCRARSMRL